MLTATSCWGSLAISASRPHEPETSALTTSLALDRAGLASLRRPRARPAPRSFERAPRSSCRWRASPASWRARRSFRRLARSRRPSGTPSQPSTSTGGAGGARLDFVADEVLPSRIPAEVSTRDSASPTRTACPLWISTLRRDRGRDRAWTRSPCRCLALRSLELRQVGTT